MLFRSSFLADEDALPTSKKEASPDVEFEIDIEDDTPEDERSRKPTDPEKVRQLEVDVDDLDKYSKEAKDKIIKMKRVWNDERRAKEAAIREQQAALEAAQQLMEENTDVSHTSRRFGNRVLLRLMRLQQ